MLVQASVQCFLLHPESVAIALGLLHHPVFCDRGPQSEGKPIRQHHYSLLYPTISSHLPFARNSGTFFLDAELF